METLLKSIVVTQSQIVILDVTGVSYMDTHVTNHLIRTVQSTSLIGAQCIMTGVRPEIAQTLAAIDANLGELVIKRDMQDGLRYALGLMGYEI